MGVEPLVGGNEMDALSPKTGVEGLAVVGFIPNQVLRAVPRKDAFDRLEREGRFTLPRAFDEKGNRSSMAVGHGHDLIALANAGPSGTAPPFLAGTKVASMKPSKDLIHPTASASRTKSSTIFSKAPKEDHL